MSISAQSICATLRTLCSTDPTRVYLGKILVGHPNGSGNRYSFAYATDGRAALEVNLGMYAVKPDQFDVPFFMAHNNMFVRQTVDELCRLLDACVSSSQKRTVSLSEIDARCDALIRRVHETHGEFERDPVGDPDWEPEDTAYLWGRVRILGMKFNVVLLKKLVHAMVCLGADDAEMCKDEKKVGFYAHAMRGCLMGFRETPYSDVEREDKEIVEDFYGIEGGM